VVDFRSGVEVHELSAPDGLGLAARLHLFAGRREDERLRRGTRGHAGGKAETGSVEPIDEVDELHHLAAGRAGTGRLHSLDETAPGDGDRPPQPVEAVLVLNHAHPVENVGGVANLDLGRGLPQP
jgi:hypothetical protein